MDLAVGQPTPSPSNNKTVVAAVVSTAIVTTLILVLGYYICKKLSIRKKVKLSFPSSVTHGNPLLETNIRSDFWNQHKANVNVLDGSVPFNQSNASTVSEESNNGATLGGEKYAVDSRQKDDSIRTWSVPSKGIDSRNEDKEGHIINVKEHDWRQESHLELGSLDRVGPLGFRASWTNPTSLLPTHPTQNAIVAHLNPSQGSEESSKFSDVSLDDSVSFNFDNLRLNSGADKFFDDSSEEGGLEKGGSLDHRVDIRINDTVMEPSSLSTRQDSAVHDGNTVNKAKLLPEAFGPRNQPPLVSVGSLYASIQHVRNVSAPATFNFTPKPVPSLPPPPALVSEVIFKEKTGSIASDIVSSVPVKSVAAAFAKKSSERDVVQPSSATEEIYSSVPVKSVAAAFANQSSQLETAAPSCYSTAGDIYSSSVPVKTVVSTFDNNRVSQLEMLSKQLPSPGDAYVSEMAKYYTSHYTPSSVFGASTESSKAKDSLHTGASIASGNPFLEQAITDSVQFTDSSRASVVLFSNPFHTVATSKADDLRLSGDVSMAGHPPVSASLDHQPYQVHASCDEDLYPLPSVPHRRIDTEPYPASIKLAPELSAENAPSRFVLLPQASSTTTSLSGTTDSVLHASVASLPQPFSSVNSSFPASSHLPPSSSNSEGVTLPPPPPVLTTKAPAPPPPPPLPSTEAPSPHPPPLPSTKSPSSSLPPPLPSIKAAAPPPPPPLPISKSSSLLRPPSLPNAKVPAPPPPPLPNTKFQGPPPPPPLPGTKASAPPPPPLPGTKASAPPPPAFSNAKAPSLPPPPPPPLPATKSPMVPPPLPSSKGLALPTLPNGKGPPMPPPIPGAPRPPKGPPLPPSAALRIPLASKPPQIPQQDPSQNLQKLKPLHWDKVRADPSHSMVWDRLKTGSFELNEDEITALFGTKPSVTKELGKAPTPAKKKSILDSKKAHNIAIQLRALNISTQDICDALLEGGVMKADLLEVLVKMVPTQEEQKALLEFSGDRSELGPAERFLKSVLEIPNAFQRVQALQYKASFNDELTAVQNILKNLEAACVEVKENRLFLKLLEAVLKTGNRMNKGTNRGEAEAFKLDTLLRLSDVKSADGKTSLLHFVTEEIIKSEGLKAVRRASNDADSSMESLSAQESQKKDNEVRRKGLEVVWQLCMQLGSLKNAAAVDADALNQSVMKLANGLLAIQNRLKTTFQVQAQVSGIFSTEDTFHGNMEAFCAQAEDDVIKAKESLARVLDRVKQVTVYFHGNTRETQPLRLFVIVRDFVGMLEKVCKDLARPLKMNLRG